jgi:hypothetical protein
MMGIRTVQEAVASAEQSSTHGPHQAAPAEQDLRSLRPPLPLAEEVGGLLGAREVLFSSLPAAATEAQGLINLILRKPAHQGIQSPEAPVVSCSRCAFFAGNSTTTSCRDCSS